MTCLAVTDDLPACLSIDNAKIENSDLKLCVGHPCKRRSILNIDSFSHKCKEKKQYNAFCLHSIVQHSSSYQNLKLRSSSYYQLWRQFPEVPAWSIILLHLDNYWYKYNIHIYCIGHGHSDCIDTTILQHSWREGKEMFYWNLWIHILTLPLHFSYGLLPSKIYSSRSLQQNGFLIVDVKPLVQANRSKIAFGQPQIVQISFYKEMPWKWILGGCR